LLKKQEKNVGGKPEQKLYRPLPVTGKTSTFSNLGITKNQSSEMDCQI